ncbi:S8 family serine peptidase [Geodermatophilus sp. YIM 151500]|uniref:S8 family peptidase n=1 Tax=Geodermatophilus sp. YIM 151500 TaxID=2984531 RepID=UPI0021E4A879|nr:S8 family serine peptidase [Geodermatophilus sp. YIM 151500]MCV2489840.1 S8 family serine peptidase [Geodermatophilus sp. YIM 151500]
MQRRSPKGFCPDPGASRRRCQMAVVPEFRYAPPERRPEPEIKAQRAAVRAHIERWVAQMADAAQRQSAEAQALTALRERRATPFELDRDEFPVAPNRLLVRRAHAAAVMRALEEEYATQEVPIPGLEQICVLQDIGAGKRRLRASGSVARALDGRAVPSYVVLLGAVRKAEGGPEPSGPPSGELWRMEGADDRDAGPLVVIIDNGVSAEHRADGWLAGLARADNLDLLNVVPRDDYLDLGAGHGTFAAGIVQQVAPVARIEVRRALDTDGVGDEVEVAREIMSAARDGAEIVNLSLGFVTAEDRPPVALEEAIRCAIRVAQEEHGKHLVLVCAAGNYGDERPCWPATFCRDPEFADHVVSVAALRLDYENDNEVVGAEWSTHGDWVTCSTLGQGVVSTYVVGTESPAADKQQPDTFPRNSWATWSGTSFAAPQIVGAIVRTMQEEGLPTARGAFQRLLAGGDRVIPGYGTSIRILPV